jgi:hypothetical protein
MMPAYDPAEGRRIEVAHEAEHREKLERVATPFQPENLRLRPQFRSTTQASFFGKEGSVSEVCGISIWTP